MHLLVCVKLQQCRIAVEAVQHAPLLVIVWGKDNVVNDVLESLRERGMNDFALMRKAPTAFPLSVSSSLIEGVSQTL